MRTISHWITSPGKWWIPQRWPLLTPDWTRCWDIKSRACFAHKGWTRWSLRFLPTWDSVILAWPKVTQVRAGHKDFFQSMNPLLWPSQKRVLLSSSITLIAICWQEPGKAQREPRLPGRTGTHRRWAGHGLLPGTKVSKRCLQMHSSVHGNNIKPGSFNSELQQVLPVANMKTKGIIRPADTQLRVVGCERTCICCCSFLLQERQSQGPHCSSGSASTKLTNGAPWKNMIKNTPNSRCPTEGFLHCYRSA